MTTSSILDSTFYIETSSTSGVNVIRTPTGSEYAAIGTKSSSPGRKGDISPRLYFRYVKSKLTVIETRKHQSQIDKLSKLIHKADVIGQFGLSEELSIQLAICVRELEAKACGIEFSIDRSVIRKYRHHVKDVNVRLCSLESYPRVIENSIHKKIQRIQKKNLFDSYEVLYLDYSGSNAPKKSNKQKIIEKDPILFGVYNYAPDKMYFILDWVDEYCDLTMDKLLDKVRESDPEYSVEHIPDVSSKTIDRIVREVSKKHERLKNTNVDNYEELAAQEEQGTIRRLIGWGKSLFK